MSPRALPSSRRGRLVVTVVLAALVTVAALGVVLLSVQWRQDVRSDQAAREGVDAATRLTPELLSYDFRTFDADAARIEAAGTGPFQEQNRAVLRGLVRPAALEGQAVAKATVSAAALVSSAPDRAVVLVFFTQTTTLNSLPGPRIENRSARVSLLRADDGRWLVTGFDAV